MVSSINSIMYNLELLNKENAKVTYGLSSGEALENGSDDSSKYDYILTLQNSVNSYSSIEERINASSSFNSMSDASTADIKSAMESINTQILKSLGDTVNSNDREIIASEIEGLRETMFSLVNDSTNGEYLFAGSDTSSPAFVEDETTGAITYVGNNENKNVNTGVNNYSSAGINGIELMYYTSSSATSGESLTFNDNEIIQDENGEIYTLLDTNNDGSFDGLYLNGDENLTPLSITDNLDGTYSTTNTLTDTSLEVKHSYFDDIDELITSLNNNDTSELSTALEKFESAYDNTNMSHAKLGNRTAIIDRYSDITQSKLTHFTLLSEEFASADLTELAIKSQSLENTYTALYSTINKVNSLSLVNYLN